MINRVSHCTTAGKFIRTFIGNDPAVRYKVNFSILARSEIEQASYLTDKVIMNGTP